MEINGLPVHPLIVHAAVVLIPIASILGLVHALVPRWRWSTRWPMVGFAVAALAAVMVAYFSGRSLLDELASNSPQFRTTAQSHQEQAEVLFYLTMVFMVVVLISAWALGGPSALASGRGGKPRHAPLIEWTMMSMLAIFSVALILMTFQTGVAGAQLVWG
ncbi:MAG: hypothetical protein L0H93_12270 [Nocardioides sp.]|nr:hypothetical protein [Nocardioides sp.]